MKVGDLVRWQSWDKRVRVGLIVRLFRPGQNRDLWAYTQEGDAIKADDPHVEVINESRCLGKNHSGRQTCTTTQVAWEGRACA